MSRRNFLNDFLKFSVLGAGSFIIPKDVYAKEMDKLYKKIMPASPYHIYSSESSFSNILSSSSSFPKAIRTRVLEYSPGKKIWAVGEGKTSIDLSFPKIKGKGFTPAHIFHGPKTEVYGQYIVDTIGLIGIIRGFDGRYYRVYPNFSKIFNAKYHCYGLPAEHFRTVSCGYCNESYVKQRFKAVCEGEYNTLYAWLEGCSESSTGYHDNIRGEKPSPCGISAGEISIGKDW